MSSSIKESGSFYQRVFSGTRRKAWRCVLIAFGFTWVLMILVGLWVLWGYENTPGQGGTPPLNWPAASRVQRHSNPFTLIMLVHPHCPCTRASINELALIMARGQGRLTAHLLFLKPDGTEPGWERSDLWESASTIPGVEVMTDEGGAEAHLFNAATSGQVLLYDAGGRLVFSGGITGARGHEGDNAGRDAITSLLISSEAERTETVVFGCSLLDENCKQESERHDHAR
ncbi:MAG TPA: hypothetical protein VGV59_10090 [Pyrinomonadaceae bacterium]|nr:hypothetical protein [Pyrinomonadaceae bacterium]